MIHAGRIESDWDIIVIGGGVTGAAIFMEAARAGLRSLLVEQNDYAWGTSSRSSKMVHGGLRYLKEGKIRLTRASVCERQHLLKHAPGLVEPLVFLMPIFSDMGPSQRDMTLGLGLYSLMALEKQHSRVSSMDMVDKVPAIRSRHLTGGFYFKDAQVDDARLVLRLIQQGVDHGGIALNYTRVNSILRNNNGKVAGVSVHDTESGISKEFKAGAVINATGAWAEKLHPLPLKGHHVRPLRGSHLIFPRWKIPLDQVVSFAHPRDLRPVFLFPWDGTAVLGTTDVDHCQDLDVEPSISRAETDYLMEGLKFILPNLNVSEDDCIASMAGVRPVLSTGKSNTSASKESRDYGIWDNQGFVTVTGGKLTTFRLVAMEVLKTVQPYLPRFTLPTKKTVVFDKLDILPEILSGIDTQVCMRLCGRYGNHVSKMLESCDRALLESIEGTRFLWAELRYAACHEQVRHLSDVLLRRTRIGLMLPNGGADHFNEIKIHCQEALGWDEERWARELSLYNNEWQHAYAPPGKIMTKPGNKI